MKQLLTKNFPFLLGTPALLWQVLFFYVPLICVVALSFKTFSFEYFIPFFSPIYFAVIFRTLLLALFTAVSCLVIAYPVAYWIAFNAHRWKNVMILFLLIPFWTNFLLHVYAWIFVLERNGVVNSILLKIGLISEPLHFLNTLFAVGLIMVYCYLPFMILPIYSSLEKFDKSLLEASSDLGGTWWQTFWRVIAPLSLPGIRSGFFLVFVPAFGEFAIPELVGGDKVMFAGSIVSHYTLSANTVSLGAAFTLLASVVVVCIIGLIYCVMHGFSKKV